MEKEIRIKTDSIDLDQFLKLSGAVDSGGRAKQLVREGVVRVNGEVETRRGRRLIPGDTVLVSDGSTFRLARE